MKPMYVSTEGQKQQKCNLMHNPGGYIYSVHWLTAGSLEDWKSDGDIVWSSPSVFDICMSLVPIFIKTKLKK